MSTDAEHAPVLSERVVALVAPALDRPGAVLVDATVGLGGHAEAILTQSPRARLVGIDRDRLALERSGHRLAGFGDRVTLVHAVYDEIAAVVARLDLSEVAGVLFDLGVSSMQLDLAERGFAYARDTPLDMRMDDTAALTAADVLNGYPVEDLVRVLREYGEERFARRIAESIVREREQGPFTGSARLVELVRAAIPAPARRTGGHPAKRTFQALRIEVNDELAVLRRALPAAIETIGLGGRVVVMSYHSLEDRITKETFATVTRSQLPPELPFVPEGARTRAPAGDPRRGDGVRGGGRRKPTVGIGTGARRRTSAKESGRMSAWLDQARGRMPRIAEAAVERARLTVVSRAPRSRTARVPFAVLVSAVLVLGIAGLLLFNTSMQQVSFTTTSLAQRAESLAARQQSFEDGAGQAPGSAAGRRAGTGVRDGPRRQPGVPAAHRWQGAGRRRPRDHRERASGDTAAHAQAGGLAAAPGRRAEPAASRRAGRHPRGTNRYT